MTLALLVAAVAPYVAAWEGEELRLDEARVSAVPMCRVWPGHQRELSQTERAHFVRFDVASSGTFVLRGADVARRLTRLLPLRAETALAREGDDALRLAVTEPGASSRTTTSPLCGATTPGWCSPAAKRIRRPPGPGAGTGGSGGSAKT